MTVTPLGQLSDMHGGRPYLAATGIFHFLTASVAAGVATDLPQPLTARTL
ncbi:hypothetical protein [Streptomyces sp. NPDC059262]